MKFPIFLAVMLTCITATAFAQQSPPDHATHQPALEQNAAGMSDGEVRRVDRDAGKLTIRHGPIRNLDMPPMTMVFQVKDPAMLDKLNTGDKIKFRAEKSGTAYIVMQIETKN